MDPETKGKHKALVTLSKVIISAITLSVKGFI